MKVRIYLSSPTMHGEEQKYVQEAFDTNWVAPLGPNVDAFEREITAYLSGEGDGAPCYGAALVSGTAALHLSVRLLDIEPGDVVIGQSLTFAASVNPVAYEKATPVFIDSEPDTWNMSPEALKEALKKYPHAKAVIPVHLYGTPAKMDEINAICAEYGVPVIEDAAEALGATYKGRRCGTLGMLNALSFNGNKIITTSGGGMLISSDKVMVDRARFLSTQARDPAPHYQHSVIGYNYRMSNLVAGVGRGQLIHLEEHVAKKKEIYQTYKDALEGDGAFTMNPLNKDGEANYWLSCVTLSDDAQTSPADIMGALAGKGIESRPIWKPMHLQPVFEGCDFFPAPEAEGLACGSVSEDIFNRGLCLPSDIKNTDADMEEILDIVRNIIV